MPGDILGEPSNNYAANGFVGSDTAGGAFVGFRNPKRKKPLSPAEQSVFNNALTLPPISDGAVRAAMVLSGAEKPVDPPATTMNVTPVNPTNDAVSTDPRVKIRVPKDYLSGSLTALLSEFGGVLFPYTPQITLEHKADYTSQNPTHSNYTLQFYKTSSVTDITITGKFTVQNDDDANIYLATSHLLSALTKMRWGGKGGDSDSGAPPPVCRLDAYGSFMFKNVPVVITSFKHDLPDDVDFYTVHSEIFGSASVPTKATFTVNCKPAYSRQEILSTSVTKYLNDPSTRQQGYL